MTTDVPTNAKAQRRRRIRITVGVGVVLAVIAGGVIWWVDRGRHLYFPKNWGVVVEGQIYRSGRIDKGLIEDTLREHGIDLVLDLAARDRDHPDLLEETAATRRLGIRKVDFIGLDGYGTGDLQDYVLAMHEIVRATEEGQRVLVHCAGGSERTGTVVALYRMLFQGWDGALAWDEYKTYRNKPPERPNLPDYVNANLDDFVRRLRGRGVDVAVPDPRPHFGPRREETR